jgi:A/G-specific adenine glycosylase
VLVRPSEVLNWGSPRLRDLPWRRTRDPWAVLVSEVMLQQTQSARVVPKWLAFMDAFPTPSQCAAAPLGDVLRLWQGLGYPRRARNIHDAARLVHAAGSFPRSYVDLRALPGVGPYTARAVMAFAYEDDAAVVDTNIARVYARFAGRSLRAKEVQALADEALPPGRSWEWNQCLMDLGAVLCRPTSPACSDCPLVGSCAWHGAGPDPAVGSAGVSRVQARFDGSDRQARGRLLRALSDHPLRVEDAPAVMQRPAVVARRLLESLVVDGLCVVEGDRIRLP